MSHGSAFEAGASPLNLTLNLDPPFVASQNRSGLHTGAAILLVLRQFVGGLLLRY